MKEIAVVFGGSGFLGSHVADSLSERGYKVRIFDIVPSSYRSHDQEMIVGDAMDIPTVREAINGSSVVYNFAGLADINEAANKPVETARANVLGNVILLEACRLAGIKRYVFASSVYVYSTSGSFYRASKQSSELFIEAFQERYGLPYTILRYGSLYGRRSDHRNGLHLLIHQALTKGKIVYDGTGEAMREYIHVKDAAEASVDILAPEFINQHVTLTGTEKMKVKDMIHMITEMLKKEIDVHFTDNRTGGHYEITPYHFTPRIGRKLIRNSHIDMGQGILDTVAAIYESLGDREKLINQ